MAHILNSDCSFFSEADRNNDMKSVNRKLDQPLVLLLKKIVNGKDFWYLPYLDYIPRHSMRQVRLVLHKVHRNL